MAGITILLPYFAHGYVDVYTTLWCESLSPQINLLSREDAY